MIAITVAVCASATVALAQQPGATPAPAKPAKAAAATPGAAPKDKPAAKPEGDSALRQRMENLEEQLVDMQVALGTLETLAKSGGASSASPAYRAGGPSAEGGAGDAGRVSGLESQVRALTIQVQQLSEQVRALGGQPRKADASSGFPPVTGSPVATAAAAGFGTATVSPERGDAIGGLLAGAPTQPAPQGAEVAVAALPGVGGDSANPRQAYETAYGYLLQQDYGAAEAAFDEFLKKYPNDNLAGNAQFWLGESFFVRGQFKPAASAFLKGYQTYGRSAKAPDSLLKLAMSLGRLGQKDAACSSYNELNTRFPAASADVKSRAAAEKQRAGCP